MEDFSAAVELFADDILRHMALEESALIPLARRHLSGEDWVEISVAFGANGDPRFVADPERDFADLFRRVMALAPIASDRGYGKA
jgi:hemerythrin-like domain-containing protein